MDRNTAKQNYDAAHHEMGEATRAYLYAVQVSVMAGRTNPDVANTKARVTAARSAMDQATKDYNAAKSA